MSRENVEVVRSVLAAMAAGDRESMLALADPEIVVDATRNVFNPATHVGIEGALRMLASMDEQWEEMRVEPEEYLESADRVAVIGRLIGTGRQSGVGVERFNGQVWTLRGGRVVRLEIGYTDRRAVLEAVGLAE